MDHFPLIVNKLVRQILSSNLQIITNKSDLTRVVDDKADPDTCYLCA